MLPCGVDVGSGERNLSDDVGRVGGVPSRGQKSCRERRRLPVLFTTLNPVANRAPAVVICRAMWSAARGHPERADFD